MWLTFVFVRSIIVIVKLTLHKDKGIILMKETLKVIFPMDQSASGAKYGAYLFLWIIAFALTMILPMIAFKQQWYISSSITIALIMLHLVVGVALIMAYRSYLKAADELERTIQLNAIALSAGVGIVGTSVYSILEKTQLISNIELSTIISLMSLAYALGLIIGRIKYR